MTEVDRYMGVAVRGKVKWCDATKGYGFILADDGGPDILLHANVLRNFGQSSIA
jgi:CspA family cold shock protein